MLCECYLLAILACSSPAVAGENITKEYNIFMNYCVGFVPGDHITAEKVNGLCETYLYYVAERCPHIDPKKANERHLR